MSIDMKNNILKETVLVEKELKAKCHVMQTGLHSGIQISEVNSKNELEEFVNLPHKIYAKNPYWPGQIDAKEMELHNVDQNVLLETLDFQLFIARKNGEVVGRISAFINEEYNEHWKQNIGFFGYFECINDQEIASELLNTAEQWVKDKGKEEIYGPFSYSDFLGVGFVIKGFNERPTAALPFNPDYYPVLIENCGYNKVREVLEVIGKVEDCYNITQKRVSEVEHLINGDRFTIRSADNESFLKDLLTARYIYNEAFANHWGTIPIKEVDWMVLVGDNEFSITNELFLIVEDQGEAVGFLLLEKDYNQELYNKRNRLDGKIKRIKASLIGIKSEYQKYGVGKWLLIEMAKKLKKINLEEISFCWIDEMNKKSIRLAIGMGGELAKVFRVYSKKI